VGLPDGYFLTGQTRHEETVGKFGNPGFADGGFIVLGNRVVIVLADFGVDLRLPAFRSPTCHWTCGMVVSGLAILGIDLLQVRLMVLGGDFDGHLLFSGYLFD
jgi:hypothetical protein